MNLFERQTTINDRATALTYHTSTVSFALSGLINKDYRLSFRQNLNLILIMTPQQIHLIDRLLYFHDPINRTSIMHRVFIGQARMMLDYGHSFMRRDHLNSFLISNWNIFSIVIYYLIMRFIILAIRYYGNMVRRLLKQRTSQKTTVLYCLLQRPIDTPILIIQT
ncbi:MAG: hypothetical protein Ct9H300mP2_5120 [Candidatus Neomarinimicrobiota bacterium]|nr:MAG: hypothetical protein Ct9H300mP2_5120 [Candidatus Neomarinimicrobiota bacterium]